MGNSESHYSRYGDLKPRSARRYSKYDERNCIYYRVGENGIKMHSKDIKVNCYKCHKGVHKYFEYNHNVLCKQCYDEYK
jgi:hypothetical protein